MPSSQVLPYFKKAENNQVHRHSIHHGTAGPLYVSDPVEQLGLVRDFVEACAEV